MTTGSNGDNPNGKDGESALERYLARQREQQPSEATLDPHPEVPAVAPQAPKPSGPAPLDLPESLAAEPAGFWVRGIAYFVDFIILVFISGFVMGFIGFFFPSLRVSTNFPSLVSLVVMYFYFGYFYSAKGASPGKMLMGLQVVHAKSQKKISYWRAFFREGIGKTISSLILGLGYLIVAFRADKMSLHDMIFDTRVVYRRD